MKDQLAVFKWISPRASKRIGHTLWAVLPEKDREWGRARPTAMVNYRVHHLDGLLSRRRRAAVAVSKKVLGSPYGRFGWAEDLEGNRMVLWKPPRRYRSPDRHVSME